MIQELCQEILKKDITVIASRPANGKLQVTLNMIYELGIVQHKNITMFTLDDPSSFYVEKMVSLISKIDQKEIHRYFHPCRHFQENLKIKPEPFINALEQLGNSNIKMCDLGFQVLSIDILDYILEYGNSDVMIINTLDDIYRKSQYEISIILEKLKKYARKNHTHFIIISNVDRKAESRKMQTLKDINHYKTLKKYADTIMLIYRLKEHGMYSNNLEIQIYKNGKQENYQICYHESNHEVYQEE